MRRSGGQLLVETLYAMGARKSFGIPGESYLGALDALYDMQGRLDYVICRQEGGAAFMAAAYGKLTGTPGICWVTRGPGATNAAIGVHTAMQDSAPMLLLIGQVGTDMKGREAFQEIDYTHFFGSIAKWVVEIDQVDRIPELIARAWKTACSGRPGPVIIALPEDMLSATSDQPPPQKPTLVNEPAPNAQIMERVQAMLSAAKQPLILLGGCNWNDAGRKAIQDFAERAQIPVGCVFRYQDQFDNHSDVFCGEAGVGMPPHMRQIIQNADTILAINLRFGEMTTDGYALLQVPTPQQHVIHVHADDDELGKIYIPDLAIQAGPNAFVAALRDVRGDWHDWCASARESYLTHLKAPAQPSGVDMAFVIAHLQETLNEDVILTNGAGNFSIWPNKFFMFGAKARLLAPQSGAMGYGLPAAIAAQIAFPERQVVCFAGDGDFQMTSQELATAAQAGLRPIILVLNNGIYGTIRAHQERHYPTRISGTQMQNPDFAAIAQAHGLYGARVETTAGFASAFAEVCAAPKGGLLDLNISSEAITPRQTLADIRRLALKEAAP